MNLEKKSRRFEIAAHISMLIMILGVVKEIIFNNIWFHIHLPKYMALVQSVWVSYVMVGIGAISLIIFITCFWRVERKKLKTEN
tara:strand:+ start:7315 stop:7566 length:252 start_codon:yes stop_codon:yes gene_type:complete